MRTIIRNIALYAVALFLLPQFLPGVSITGGFGTYLFGGFVLTLMLLLLKPILSLLSFPLNLATMGLFSVFINVIILYLLTVAIPSINIHHFVYEGTRFAGFVIPRLSVNTFFAFVLSALFLWGIVHSIQWVAKT